MVETNDAMARIYGFESVEEMGEWRMEDYFDRDSEVTQASLLALVRAGYRIRDIESIETPPGGSPGHYLNNCLPEIEDGKLVRLWGTSRDVTAVRRAEEEVRRKTASPRRTVRRGPGPYSSITPPSSSSTGAAEASPRDAAGGPWAGPGALGSAPGTAGAGAAAGSAGAG